MGVRKRICSRRVSGWRAHQLKYSICVSSNIRSTRDASASIRANSTSDSSVRGETTSVLFREFAFRLPSFCSFVNHDSRSHQLQFETV